MTCASERAAARCAVEAPDVVLQNTQSLVGGAAASVGCIAFAGLLPADSGKVGLLFQLAKGRLLHIIMKLCMAADNQPDHDDLLRMFKKVGDPADKTTRQHNWECKEVTRD